MITLRKLTWSNWFSYGEDNIINFESSNLTQLLGENGCIMKGSTIMGTNGEVEYIEDMVRNKIDYGILGENKNNTVTSNIEDFIESGEKEVFKVQLDSGDLLYITDNHKLKTYEGWKPLKDIKVNDFILNTRNKPISEIVDYNEIYWKILTYLITEGGLTDINNKITFTNKDENISKNFNELLQTYDNNISINCTDTKRSFNYYIVYNRNRESKINFIKYISKSINPIDYSINRYFPNEVIRLPKDMLYKILAIYLDTDGCLSTDKTHLSFSTSSKKLSQQLLFILRNRLGLLTSIRTKKTYKADNYEINITRLDNIQKLLKQILPYMKGYKIDLAQKYINKKTTSSSYTQDLIPAYLIRDSLVKQSIPGEKIYDSVEQKRAGLSLKATKHGITRKNYNILSSGNKIKTIGEISNITFLRIKNIESIGTHQVYDLTTSTTNFHVDNILVHNSGKTSIIHIIEEILYNKNSRGVKKSDIMNRNKKEMLASLYFNVDGIDYVIDLKRKTTAKISLFKEGVDISSHTATNTFKDIQKIIGLDFQTFTQLVYQNSKKGLEFLTSPDSARKKFLTNLFNLNKYSDYYEVFKKAYNEVNLSVKELEGKQKVLTDWVNTHKDTDFTIVQHIEKPDDSKLETYLNEKAELNIKTNNIDEENRKILKNNRAVADFNRLDIPDNIPDKPIIDETLGNKKAVLDSNNNARNKIIRELKQLTEHNCPTCLQKIDESIKENMLTEAQQEILKNNKRKIILIDEMHKQEKSNMVFNKISREHILYDNAYNAIDHSIDSDIYDPKIMKERISVLEGKYNDLKSSINTVISHNSRVTEKNAKLETILVDLEKNRKDLIEVKNKTAIIEKSKSNLNILKTVFSTKGLISFKIDFLVKDLQDSINEYLVELSSGRFQLNFVLAGDSINIAIIDNGNTINITALSAGELARVNAATLLAIRKLMSGISNTKINLLFLDEILGVLDENGKATLIDVLLKEKDLNTFIVSHEYTHPLLEKLYVSIEEGGSKID